MKIPARPPVPDFTRMCKAHTLSLFSSVWWPVKVAVPAVFWETAFSAWVWMERRNKKLTIVSMFSIKCKLRKEEIQKSNHTTHVQETLRLSGKGRFAIHLPCSLYSLIVLISQMASVVMSYSHEVSGHRYVLVQSSDSLRYSAPECALCHSYSDM